MGRYPFTTMWGGGEEGACINKCSYGVFTASYSYSSFFPAIFKKNSTGRKDESAIPLLCGLNKSMCRLFDTIIAPLSHKMQIFYFEKLAVVLINCVVLKVSSMYAVN